MKPNTAEEPGIAKNQGALRLMQSEVVMVFRGKSRGLGAQLSGHPKMDPDPISTGKFEQHLFSPGDRAQKPATGYLARQCPGVRAPKDSFLPVELHAHDFLADPAIPLPAIKFDFGQLRHRAK